MNKMIKKATTALKDVFNGLVKMKEIELRSKGLIK